MRAIKIRCPKCGRVMGDTNESLDCNLNCRGCRETSLTYQDGSSSSGGLS